MIVVNSSLPSGQRPLARAFREYLESTKPASRTKMVLGYSLLFVAFVMGPVALFVQPIAPGIVAIYAIFGAAIGVLYVTGLMLLRMIGLAMYMLYLHSVMAYAQARSANGDVSDFTGECVVISVWVLIGFGPHIFLKALDSLRHRRRVTAAR